MLRIVLCVVITAIAAPAAAWEREDRLDELERKTERIEREAQEYRREEDERRFNESWRRGSEEVLCRDDPWTPRHLRGIGCPTPSPRR